MKQYPSVPRVHGNAFIQIDLDPRRRMHIWDHRIPGQVRDSSIHDHAFWFESECRMGTLINVPMQVFYEPGRYGLSATHDLYEVVRVPNSEEDTLQITGEPVRFGAGDAQLIHPGESYRFEAHKFHVSLHLGTTVTIMRRDPEYAGGGRALVACRVGEDPDNTWVREQPIPEWAWDLIRQYGETGQ